MIDMAVQGAILLIAIYAVSTVIGVVILDILEKHWARFRISWPLWLRIALSWLAIGLMVREKLDQWLVTRRP